MTMTYTIGIGVLLEGDAFNLVRNLESKVAEVVLSTVGLDQPPHVTIKRPFKVKSLNDIEDIQVILSELVSNIPPFGIEYSGLNTFGDKVLYLAVKQPNIALQSLHSTILSRLSESYEAHAPFEGDEMIFHTSVATNLQSNLMSPARSAAENSLNFGAGVVISKVGIFMGLDSDTRWVVISEHKLGKASRDL